jgi:ribonucleoside-diphosphate reductase alpha chain
MDVATIADRVWRSKYRFSPAGSAVENSIDESLRRVGHAIAAPERQPGVWAPRFCELLDGLHFIPGGRVLAGAGTGRRVTLFNCFVCGRLPDSLEGILRALTETALTMQQGGGVGIDFSPLRPAGSIATSSGSAASGPLPFMRLWDTLCETLLSTSSRRGAMMGTLACDHPDIGAFIDAKRTPGALSNFNLSVLVSDAFMQAVADDESWPLAFPTALPGHPPGCGPAVARRVSARRLFRRIAEAAHGSAEPGILFVDTINRENNLSYCESISATNPCGEVPLPPYGACDLGSVNLARLVADPFGRHSRFDADELRRIVAVAVRFLDDVIDASGFPLELQATQARKARRIGLGVTGLADALAMLGLRYDSDQGREFAVSVLRQMRDTAYRASIELAAEKSAFPCFDADAYLAAPFVSRLPDSIRDGIAKYGIRNSHLISIAPAGTISLLAGNVSSGIEPIYALEASRGIRDADGARREYNVRDLAYELWLQAGRGTAKPAGLFETAESLPATAHLAMQACLQPFVDNAISKTITLSTGAGVGDVESIYRQAWQAGVKGCTVFRPGATVGQVIRRRADTHCCHIDREAD